MKKGKRVKGRKPGTISIIKRLAIGALALGTVAVVMKPKKAY